METDVLRANPDGASKKQEYGVVQQERWANIWDAILAGNWPDER
jgi:hypothetical protein